MLKKVVAKTGIVQGWQQWSASRNRRACEDMHAYFLWLQANKPERLRFRDGGQDKWQQIRAWLNEYERNWRPAGLT